MPRAIRSAVRNSTRSSPNARRAVSPGRDAGTRIGRLPNPIRVRADNRGKACRRRAPDARAAANPRSSRPARCAARSPCRPSDRNRDARRRAHRADRCRANAGTARSRVLPPRNRHRRADRCRRAIDVGTSRPGPPSPARRRAPRRGSRRPAEGALRRRAEATGRRTRTRAPEAGTAPARARLRPPIRRAPSSTESR